MNDKARFWIKLASVPLAVQGLFLGLKLAKVVFTGPGGLFSRLRGAQPRP